MYTSKSCCIMHSVCAHKIRLDTYIFTDFRFAYILLDFVSVACFVFLVLFTCARSRFFVVCVCVCAVCQIEIF